MSENSYFLSQDDKEYASDETKNSMSENETREHGILKRDAKRTTNNSNNQTNVSKYLTKTSAEIRQEFRKLPNPPAKDTRAAKYELRVYFSRSKL